MLLLLTIVGGAPAPTPMQRATAGVNALQSYYYAQGADDSIWGVGWWHDANCMECLCTFMQHGTDASTQYLDVLRSVYHRQPARAIEVSGSFDDVGWWGMAWARAFELTRNATYLARAELCWQRVASAWNDGACGGGVWWTSQRRYKNAITNELFLALSARLYGLGSLPAPGRLSRRNSTYLAWARREWAWFEASGMITSGHQVRDGLDSGCTALGRCFTYNGGVVLGGLAWLYMAEKDAAGGVLPGNNTLLMVAKDIADATIANKSWADGILREDCDVDGSCNADAQSFKGIFVRYVRLLADTLPPSDVAKAAVYHAWLARNAASVWGRDRAEATALAPMLFGPNWEGPLNATDTDDMSIATRSALDLLLTQL